MFSELTDAELIALFAAIKRYRDRNHQTYGYADGHYEATVEASDIMTDIHNENATR